MITAIDVAGYFLTIVDRESGDTLTNLKLQKLLYYAQGFSLALLFCPLFEEKIISWALGPIVLEVYERYKRFGSDAIPEPTDFDINKIDESTRKLLDKVFEEYGQFSAAALVNMTHGEPPWRSTQIHAEIEHKKIENYFRTRLRYHDDEKNRGMEVQG